MRHALAWFTVLTLFGSGCGFYFGGDDDDCQWGGANTPGEAMSMRNPYTGQCEYYGGDWTCDDPCSPCYGAMDMDAIAMPSWAYCDGMCESLDEATCLVTSGCRAAYIDDMVDCDGADCGPGYSFYACWGTDQTGPIEGGGCSGLDAWECSRHDDCIAVHYGNGCYADQAEVPVECDPLGEFEMCVDEAVGCYGDEECPDGMRCNADELCLPAPGCTDSNGDGIVDCEAVCYGYCVPGDPPPPPSVAGTCDEAMCDMVSPACPEGTVPGVADGCYTGYCIPETDCEAVADPGNCWDEVLCYCITPACPDGTVPGVAEGCYTGYCIPETQCEEPPVPCSSLTDEQSCIDRFDCAPYYEGVNCTCDGDECICEDWIFDSCQDAEPDPALYTVKCG